MKKKQSKITDKLYFQRYILGISKYNVQEMIRKKEFAPAIKWLPTRSFKIFRADPFFVYTENNSTYIFYEEFFLKEDYAGIALLKLDKDFNEISHKIILDTGCHLSFPFVFREAGKIYVFPESGQSGRFSCYEFDPESESLTFIKDILELPLVDSTIIKYNDKYWLIGSLSSQVNGYELNVFYSDNLLGPFQPHRGNPVRSGFDGIRSAGDFIQVDGSIYRPAQNCKNEYGESITINKVTHLNELMYNEEAYMEVSINANSRRKYNMRTIHTINSIDGLIIVDGKLYSFAPGYKFIKWIRGINLF